jgi:hypothetical protein
MDTLSLTEAELAPTSQNCGDGKRGEERRPLALPLYLSDKSAGFSESVDCTERVNELIFGLQIGISKK